MMDGMRIYYNFIRPHMALNRKTPAEAAGINLQLGQNIWKTLIRQSATSKKRKDSSQIDYSFNQKAVDFGGFNCYPIAIK